MSADPGRLARLRREAAEILRLGLPLVLSKLAVMAMNLVDALLAGRIGAEALAAVALATALWSLGLMWLMGLLMALPPTVAQLRGAGRQREAAAAVVQAGWIMLGMVVILLGLLQGAQPVLRWAGAEAAVVALASDFLAAMAWGLPGLGLYLLLHKLSEGLGLTWPSMVLGLAGLAVLWPLGYGLAFGAWGFPELGVAGLGLAHALVYWLQALALLAWVAIHPGYADLDWRSAWAGPRPGPLLPLLRLGLPIAVTVFMEGSLFAAVALLVAGLGTVATAAHQVALNVASLCFMVPLGLAMAVTIRVGHAAGRGDAAGVRSAGMAGLALTLLTQGVSASVMLLLPGLIVAAYTPDAEVRALAVQLLLLAALFQFSDGIQTVCAGALRGLKDARVPMLVTVLSYWGVGLPVAVWLAFGQDLGVHGLWSGLIAGLTMAAAALFWRFERRSRLALASHP